MPLDYHQSNKNLINHVQTERSINKTTLSNKSSKRLTLEIVGVGL